MRRAQPDRLETREAQAATNQNDYNLYFCQSFSDDGTGESRVSDLRLSPSYTDYRDFDHKSCHSVNVDYAKWCPYIHRKIPTMKIPWSEDISKTLKQCYLGQ